MSFIADLRAIVREEALAFPNAEGVLLLDDEQAEMTVRISAPAPMVAVRFGQQRHRRGDERRMGVAHGPGLVDSDGRELYMICDYLLVVEWDGCTHAVLVELKTTWKWKAVTQVRRSLPLLEYLRSVCEVERKASLRDDVKTGYLIICAAPGQIDKQTVKPEPLKHVVAKDHQGRPVRTYVGTRLSPAILTGVTPT